MLIAYKLPADWTYTISTSWITPDNEVLHDNSPAELVRFAWDDTDPQTTGNTVIIGATRATAFVARAGCLLGTSFPVGLKVEILGKRAADPGYSYDLGGNSMTQKTVRFADGTVGLYWVFDEGLDPIVGYQVTFYNDVAGSPSILPEAAVDIGQIRVGPAVLIPHEVGWSDGPRDPSIIRRTLGGQVQRVGRTPWRTGKLKPAYGRVDKARGGALANGLDWQQLNGILAKDPFCIIFPRWEDIDDAQKTAVFGLVTVPAIDHRAGPIYQMQELGFEEIPAG